MNEFLLFHTVWSMATICYISNMSTPHVAKETEDGKAYQEMVNY